MVRHSIGILTVIALTSISEGCAVVTRGTIGAVVDRQPRTLVSDPLRREGPDPSWSAFDARRRPAKLPTNLPLPSKADPGRLFEMKSPSPRTIDAALAVAGGVTLFICEIGDALVPNSTSNDCVPKPSRAVEYPKGKKPTINR